MGSITIERRAAGDRAERQPRRPSAVRARRRGAEIHRQRLLPARHREPDLGQQQRIEQRAVQAAVRVVDAEALAQRIEAVALAGEHLAGERQRVGQLPVGRRRGRVPGERELDVEERDVERRVVDDPLGAAREIEELGGDVAEFRLALEVVPRLAVHFGRADVDLALRDRHGTGPCGRSRAG